MIQKTTLQVETKRRRLEEFARHRRRRGVPLTVQRRLILEAVLDLGPRPTADEVQAAVASRQAGISRAAAHRGLETLVRTRFVTKACHRGSAVRHGARAERHHHLICLRCGEVFGVSDARLDAIPVPDTSIFGFKVSDPRVQIRGLRRRCRKLEGRR